MARLLLGDIRRGVGWLRQASAAMPEDRTVQGDLAAAYLERGDPGDRVRALDLLDHAAVADAGASPAPFVRFNLAVSAARLLTPTQIADAWRLAHDDEPEPAWRQAIAQQRAAADARHRRAADSTSARWGLLLGDTAPAWAQACLQDDESRERDAWRQAQSLATGMSAAGDAAAASIVGPMRAAATGRGDAEYASALQSFLNARAAYRADDLALARVRFEEFLHLHGASSTRASSTALTLDASISLGIATYFSTRSAQALAQLEAVRARAARERLPRFTARASWMLGYLHQDRAALQRANDEYARASREAATVDDGETVAAMETLRAATLDGLGDYAGGWRPREQALERVAGIADPRVLQTVLASAARAASRDGCTRAALRLAAGARDAARAFGSPARIAEAELEHARIAARAASPAVASASVAAAEATVANVSASGLAARLRAQIDELRAILADRAADRVGHLTRAIESYRQLGADVALARLYLARARAWDRANRTHVESDLASGIEIFERVRATLGSARWRISYFEEGWALFDERIKLALEAGDARAALEAAERVQGRELIERLRSAGPRPPIANDRASLGDDARILRLMALDDRLVVWRSSASGLTVRVERISHDALQTQVAGVLDCLQASRLPRGCDARLGALYDRLLRPDLRDVRRGTRLILVPEGFLQTVPFAALRDLSRSRYLIEDFPLSLAATQTVHRAPPHLTDSSRLLLIAAAATTGDRALRDAAREAAEIGASYRHATVLDMARTTKAAATAALVRPDVDLLHFSGHAVSNPDNPDLSRLIWVDDVQPAGYDKDGQSQLGFNSQKDWEKLEHFAQLAKAIGKPSVRVPKNKHKRLAAKILLTRGKRRAWSPIC